MRLATVLHVDGDRIGRVRTLTYTILLYSIFTGFSAFSQGPFDYCAYRFLTGLGKKMILANPLYADHGYYEQVNGKITRLHADGSIATSPVLAEESIAIRGPSRRTARPA